MPFAPIAAHKLQKELSSAQIAALQAPDLRAAENRL